MPSHNQSIARKTLIGVLASHDDLHKNYELARLFEDLWDEDKKMTRDKQLLQEFHFIFTGGTFERIVLGEDTESPKRPLKDPMSKEDISITKGTELHDYLMHSSTSLPDRKNGGVTILANLIVQRQCSILWPFLSSITAHWLNPENLALMRLCDIWNEKRLMNSGSVLSWFHDEAERDAKRNPQEVWPRPKLFFGAEGFELGKNSDYMVAGTDNWLINRLWYNQWLEGKDFLLAEDRSGGGFCISKPIPKERKPEFWYKFRQQTIALIAHDEMKKRMVNFAIEYERELAAFGRILSTGTTGREVEESTRRLKSKIKPCRSGPKGGDIEIATEILYGRCDVVIFFIDPLNPHPHIEDIRTVFSACMIENEVQMLTNELQAREWMDAVVRPKVS